MKYEGLEKWEWDLINSPLPDPKPVIPVLCMPVSLEASQLILDVGAENLVVMLRQAAPKPTVMIRPDLVNELKVKARLDWARSIDPRNGRPATYWNWY
jgi:hypothetical protein